jgi:cytidylate kinase
MRYSSLYGINYDKPEEYNDIIIDSSNLNEKETFDLILKNIKDGGYIK